jgi:hypothetical protein
VGHHVRLTYPASAYAFRVASVLSVSIAAMLKKNAKRARTQRECCHNSRRRFSAGLVYASLRPLQLSRCTQGTRYVYRTCRCWMLAYGLTTEHTATQQELGPGHLVTRHLVDTPLHLGFLLTLWHPSRSVNDQATTLFWLPYSCVHSACDWAFYTSAAGCAMFLSWYVHNLHESS